MFELINSKGELEDGAHDFQVLWTSVTEAWRQLDIDDGRYKLKWDDETLFEVAAGEGSLSLKHPQKRS